MDKTINLVNKAINGNERAFEKLIKNESEKLYKTAYLYVRNKDDALDIVQDTVYKAFVSISQLQQPQYFTTWLTKILINTAYDFLNKRKKIVLDEKLMNNHSAAPVQDVEAKLDLITAVATLKQDYQTVILLFYYHDLPIRTIGEVLEMPENTVKTNLRRAKAELQKKLKGVTNDEQRATKS